MSASPGIGATVARALGRAGVTAVVCAHDGDTLQSVVNDIECDGGSANAARADVHDELDMERLMETAAHAGGRIDVLIANAAVAHGMPDEISVSEDSYAVSDDTLRTNVYGVFAAVEEALPYTADDGRTLVPSGPIAREARPGMGVYAVSKATAEALIRQFTAGCDRTVTVVDPDLAVADLTGGQGRDPDNVADLFVWAVTDVDPAELNNDVADLKV